MIMNIKEMKFGEIERFCLEQFDANNDLFKTVVKDNIERNRKGKKTIVIKDKTGAVQSGIRVKAVLKNHEFKHGAHIFMLDQFETASENERYRKRIRKEIQIRYNSETLRFRSYF